MYTTLTAVHLIVPVLLMSSQIIVGKHWPPPAWYLGSSIPSNGVVADGDPVVADGVQVVAS